MATSTRSVRIVTEIPGPRSKELLARKDAAVMHAAQIHMPVAVDHAEGALLTDVDGNTFIDFSGGIGCLNVGHSNPRVVEAIIEQTRRFTHTDFTIVMYESYIELAERLGATIPISEPVKGIFFNSGAEAVENGVKIARYATGRSGVIAFERAFHGRTLMAMSLTSKTHPYKAGFGPYAPEVYRMPYPYPLRSPLEADAHARECLSALRRAFVTHVAAEQVACMVFEPVQGEGGFIVPPQRWVEGLREICDEYGIVMIADEVQSGMGRTGRMWAMEHFGVEPDLLLTAKSIAMGMPLSAVFGKAQIMDRLPDSTVGGTYVGNPVACAAALAVLDELQGGLLERGAVVGEALRTRLDALAARDSGIAEVRGLGAMLAVEFVDAAGAPASDRATSIVDHAARNGLILLKAGPAGNCIRVLVPLNITDEQIDEAIEILDAALVATA